VHEPILGKFGSVSGLTPRGLYFYKTKAVADKLGDLGLFKNAISTSIDNSYQKEVEFTQKALSK
jgi:hypothetical protein